MNSVELIQRKAEFVFGNKVRAEVTSDAGSLWIQGTLKLQAMGILPGAISEHLDGEFWP